jgi:lipopolysaccharide transport system permease protein
LSTSPEAVTLIRPKKGWAGPGLSELWEFRELLWAMARREIAVRYKQTLLGAAWAVLQPLLTMAIFTLFFGTLARIPSEGLPYSLFALAGLVPWTYFSATLAGAANSVVDQRSLITKVYFPRLILPLTPALSGLVDLALALLVLGAFMAWHGAVPPPTALALPLFVLLILSTALAAGLWLSALNAHYRDFRFVVPFLLQVWMFASPVAYPASLVPEPWRPLYGLNPMAGALEGFRWCLLGHGEPPGPMLAVSALVVLALLGTGLSVFRRMERTLVDVV